jgi:tRNA/tmRNA/rRNA uracil-C5-methylase (TrmA/RlmC/RlmD family)
MPLRDQTVELAIRSVAYGGGGVARHEGQVWFVPGALPGETVAARRVRDRGRYAEARLVQVLNPSPHRVAPACPLAVAPEGRDPAAQNVCPGCCYQHADYAEEVRLKQGQLVELLARGAGVAGRAFDPPQPSPASLAYRNKLVLHAQKDGTDTRLGYFMEDNATVVDVAACPIAVTPIGERLTALRTAPGFLNGLRDGMTLTLRHTARDGVVWWRGRARSTETWLVERLPLGDLSVPRASFCQVNPGVADLLFREVMDTLGALRPDAVADLYCGVGVFALGAAALGVPAVIGVDADASALRAAQFNARQRGLDGVAWERARAAQGLRRIGRRLAGRRAVVIVDPPRTGLDPATRQGLLALAPAGVLYVSCAADRLARDAAAFREAGYALERVRLFDMFPRTACFETAATFVRGSMA